MTVHVTVPVDETVKADLDAWAESRGVSVDTVLSQVVEAFVAERREIETAVAEARADIAAGRVHSHEDVVARLKGRRRDWRAAE
jgi:predicted transcriptional regulator